MHQKALLVVAAGFLVLCGRVDSITEDESSRNLVTSGEPVDPDADPPIDMFPNFALIEGVYTTNDATFLCGGALLKGDIVLTSAVCLDNIAVNLTDVKVHVNISSRTDDNDGKITRGIASYVAHEDFDYDSDDWFLYDIAIVQLDQKIEGLEDLVYNRKIGVPNPNEKVHVFGFGTTSEDVMDSFTDVPNRATLSVVNHGTCNNADAWYNGQLENLKHLCASGDSSEDPSQDTCLGDTGAPLLALVDGEYQVVGITSGGDGCGRSEVPGFYTRTSNHWSFIRNRICDLSEFTDDCGPILCFSASTLVETPDRGSVAMKDLSLGDMVKVPGNNEYEPIYSFGHFDKSVVTTNFLHIQTFTSSGLEISSNHFIFVEGGQAVPASTVSVGDKVILASGETDEIISITKVTRTGIFAPYTPSGTLVTNGIKTSCFATIQDTESRYVTLGGGFEIPMTYHQLGVIFESPHRLFCHLLSIKRCKEYETYNDQGMSQWVELPMKAFQWSLKQNAVISGFLFFTSVGLWLIINLLEIMIKSVPYLLAIVGGTYSFLVCYKNTSGSCDRAKKMF